MYLHSFYNKNMAGVNENTTYARQRNTVLFWSFQVVLKLISCYYHRRFLTRIPVLVPKISTVSELCLNSVYNILYGNKKYFWNTVCLQWRSRGEGHKVINLDVFRSAWNLHYQIWTPEPWIVQKLPARLPFIDETAVSWKDILKQYALTSSPNT